MDCGEKKTMSDMEHNPPKEQRGNVLYTPHSALSPNGFTVDFDTQKRLKYKEPMQQRILKLRDNGLSIRAVAKELDIPFGSIHAILRRNGAVEIKGSKPSLSYLGRSECRWQHDMTNSQFDYVRGAYPHLTKKVGRTIYIHYRYFDDYFYGKKAYIESEEIKRKKKISVPSKIKGVKYEK